MPTPPANATFSTFQVGSYNALADTFTLVADLNDQVTTYADITIHAPELATDTSENPRTQGQQVRGAHFRNRQVEVSLTVKGASAQAILNSVNGLVAALQSPPYVIRYAYPGASFYSYLDVKPYGCTHDFTLDPKRIAGGAMKGHVIFECAPFYRWDRQVLDNLVVNPGFEAPSGGGTAQGGVTVFADTFANANAYATALGSNPTIASNVLTIPGASAVKFGSPAWGAINTWQARFQTPTAGAVKQPRFVVHFTDSNNYLGVLVNYTSLVLNHRVGGVDHSLASASMTTLVDTTWYWIRVTLFPSVAGNPPLVQATLFADSAGAVGAQLATVGPTAAFDAVTAMTGYAAIWNNSSNSMAVGGNFVNVHFVQLFGPGGWQLVNNGGTGVCSGAWDGTRSEIGMSGTATAGTQTTLFGPVTSFGAARLDVAPGGTLNYFWTTYNGGTPAGTQAMPVATAGDVVAVSAWVKASGLHATNASATLQLKEYDASGAFLRATNVQAANGSVINGVWTQLSGTVTTGVSCAYVAVALLLFDTSVAGESANASVWLDNVLCYDQTATGMSSMPWCDLRGPTAPYQMVVSGLLGQVATPAYLALGAYVPSWAPGKTLNFALGRRALFDANAILVGAVDREASSAKTMTLDATSYGGYYLTTTSGLAVGGSQMGGPGPAESTILGAYHLLQRALSQQSTPNIGNVTAAAGGFDGQWLVLGTPVAPFSAGSVWGMVDTGLVRFPTTAAGALVGTGNRFVTPVALWNDVTGGGSNAQFNSWALIPADGALLLIVFNNPSNSAVTNTNQWQWIYVDGLGPEVGLQTSARYYARANALPADYGSGVGGPGTTSSTYPNVNLLAEPYLTLDPTIGTGGNGGTGKNHLVLSLADTSTSATPYACAAQIRYSPLSLYPR